MIDHAGILLVVTVAAVGVLHTVVPDHWVPIVVFARQRGWSVARTAYSAGIAGTGHVATTLLLGVMVWGLGAALSARYAHLVSVASAIALLVFGVWIAYGGWKEAPLRASSEQSHLAHAHLHAHEGGVVHVHWHQHQEGALHEVREGVAVAHAHEHAASGRMALLLVLGSSPMIEGIPAFMAASPKGSIVLAIMAVTLAVPTIATYITMCVAGLRSLQRTSLGPLERYGEMLSGLFVAAVGLYALFTA